MRLKLFLILLDNHRASGVTTMNHNRLSKCVSLGNEALKQVAK